MSRFPRLRQKQLFLGLFLHDDKKFLAVFGRFRFQAASTYFPSFHTPFLTHFEARVSGELNVQKRNLGG